MDSIFLRRRASRRHIEFEPPPRELLFATADEHAKQQRRSCDKIKKNSRFPVNDSLQLNSSSLRRDLALIIYSSLLIYLLFSGSLTTASTIEFIRHGVNSPASELAPSSAESITSISALQNTRDRSRRQYDAPLDASGYNNRANPRTNAYMRQRYPLPPYPQSNTGIPTSYSPYGGLAMDVCAGGSCYPSTGDLLTGRERQLNATSTCGLSRPERYCVVSYLDGPIKCFYCDSRMPFGAPNMPLAEILANHRVENIIRRLTPVEPRYDPNNVNVNSEDNTVKTWYQSENGVEEVSIHLELEAEFHFTHLIITFRTFRPAAMLIERSQDRGKTWKVYRYFAQDCAESFPGIPTRQPQSINDVVCESRYSMVEPSSGGEVIFNAIPDRFQDAVTKDPYAADVQDQLKLTDLRINFTKLHTFGDNLWEGRSETDQKYYYAIEEMDVRGRCSCYGHASSCVPGNNEVAVPHKVHGQCKCRHHTTGRNCERCEEFYNDVPWRPAVGKVTHECKPCNCNNHARRCHFDESLYIASGNVSGGVCDECEHHTVGTHCEQCEQMYYLQPSRNIQDVDACVACDCHPAGSLNNGICDSITDADRSLAAGQCHCKTNVVGQHCDRCKDGFYDMQADRPEGCLACNCSLLGTVNNLGCDKHTGECVCKRNVVGEQCDRCAVGHYGMLNNYTDGCLQCDCDEGGAFDNNCDMATGQCRCRPHAVGRRCDMPEQGFFAPWLDHLRSEAEHGEKPVNTFNETREGYGAERPTTWTGPGFMKALEGSQFQFSVDNVPYSTDYNLLLRYELFDPQSFKDIDIEIVRPPADPNELGAVCDNQQSSVNYVRTDFPANQNHQLVEQPVCLEQGKNYTIILRFPPQQHRRAQQGPRGEVTPFGVNVDSVTLIPRTEELQMFQSQRGQRARDTFDRYRCLDSQLRVVKDQMHDECRDVLKSVSFYVHGGALRCECDPTGSESNVCKPLGGQCSCKKNVAGRTCSHCAVGFYGFGPNGCEQCDCDPLGSQDNFCDALSGQCKCFPNAYGRRCNQCQPGFWNYPNCRACQCYGRADTCDVETGRCLNCRENAAGMNCELCADGFYGDPRNGVPCRPCPCPGGTDGPNHAQQCRLDEFGNVLCCCEPGYAQPNCGECQFGFFGSPALPGGSCQRCDCNGNADIQQPGVCDLRTGQCLQCLFHTVGFHCENCAPGFYGPAVNGSCQPCSCNILGSDKRLGECNRVSGQCACLPNVEGRDCDRCKENHWKLASGEGCEPCSCNLEGTVDRNSGCNEFNGQCQCKANRGGRTCNDCIELHWGNPEVECQPCRCNPEGSATLQCNRGNGRCVCKPGITGAVCDQCDRGFNGTVPNCQPCGECFNNWDGIIQNLKDETQRMVKQVKRIMEKGVSGAFDGDFRSIENDLQQVEEILVRTNISETQFSSISNQLADMRTQRSDLSNRLDALTDKVRKTSRRVEDATLNLENLKNDVNDLSGQADLLERNATALQEANVEGALNLTRDASERSDRAQSQVGQTASIVHESELLREEARRKMQDAELESTNSVGGPESSNSNVANVIKDLRQLEKQLPEIDAQVCGRSGGDQLSTNNENLNDIDRLMNEEDAALSCDPICGGAGCGGRCGGVACVTGAVTRASDALRLAHNASTEIQNIMDDAKDLLNELQQVQRTSEAAHIRSQTAAEAAGKARNVSADIRGRLDNLLRQVTEVAERDAATPAQVRTLADEVRQVTIDLSPDEIETLARRISETIRTLDNVNAIIAETEGDLARTEQLLNRAQTAKNQAQRVQTTANNVTDALTAAKQAQNSADAAITRATDAIQQARRDLTATESETNDADEVVDRAHEQARRMNDQFNLDDRFVENAFRLDKVQSETNMADSDAQAAETDAQELARKFEEARKLLAQKSGSATRRDGSNNNGQAVAQRAEAIKQRAQQVRAATLSITTQLEKMTEEFTEHENTMDGLQEHLRRLEQRMAESLQVIQQREEFYGQCTN